MTVAIELKETKEKLFEGVRVYFSNSIKGHKGNGEDIGLKLVEYLMSEGADVLTEDVPLPDPENGTDTYKKRTGIDLGEITDLDERARVLRRNDLKWVDEAQIFVALVNGASYGVGMEIQKTIDKEPMGLNRTPILCLIKEDNLSGLSSMVRGVDQEREGVCFELVTYRDLAEAVAIMTEFIITKCVEEKRWREISDFVI